jgi:hypothetical protein
MGKVITSEGLTEFVTSGKFTQVTNHKPGKPVGEAPALEVVKPAAVIDVKPAGETKPEAKPAEKAQEKAAKTAEAEVEHDEALTEEEKALPEKAQKEIQRAKRAVNKKHAEMRSAQEALQEAERFAETQFNEKRLLEQRLSERESEIQALKPAKAPEPEAKEPELKDYTDDQGQVDWVKFQKDTAKFAADQAIKSERQRQADERAAAERAAHEARIAAQANRAREAHADFDEVVQSGKGTPADQAPQFVLNYLFESENSGELVYHLKKNPEVMQRIAKMKPILGIVELGKLEDSLIKPSIAAKEAPAASGAIATQRGAPAPITPLEGDGAAGIQTDPAKMSYKELRAYERARRAEKSH